MSVREEKMHGNAPLLHTPEDKPGHAQARYLYLAITGILSVLVVVCTVALWAERDDWLSRATIGLMVALLAFGSLRLRESRLHFAGRARALEREIEQYSRIFDTSLDLILVTDRQGLFTRVSPSSKAILGYAPVEMLGHIGIDFIHPDDLESTRTEMRLARRGQQIRNFETRYIRKDGSPVVLDWTGVWSESEQRHFFIGRDMTAQKLLEEAEHDAKETLTAVIDASPVAILCLAPDRTVIVWSRAAEQIFGYTAKETIGRPYMLVPEGQEAEYGDLFGRALAGETLRDIRVARRRKDGTIVDISFDAAPMHDSGRVKAVAYALSDITERNKLEQQLRQAQKMDAIGQLTGGVAHDFNNMLTVITGTIDILAQGVADEPELSAIAKLISEAADRGAELTSHLLAFARKQPLQPRPTDIRQLATEAARLLGPTLGEHFDIKWRLSEDTSPAMVDPGQLVTAIVNLAVNARDAMPDGGQLTIESGNVILDEDYANAHSEVTPGRYVMIAVSDTGPGIPASIRDKVFEPFFTTKDPGKGTGLGLSMVYGFVKQSGGHIKLYSEEGHGTTFKIYLPHSGETSSVLESLSASEVSGGDETIFVVEDDPIVRSSVTVQLESLGYRVMTAANAQDALAIVDSGAAFDLLFTDVIMSGSMNGRRLAEETAKRRGQLKVLFTSGYTENAIVHHGRLDPGVLLLPKPYRKSDLARMIRQALGVVGPSGNGIAEDGRRLKSGRGS
jgi:PAS domain S-box-containing protein